MISATPRRFAVVRKMPSSSPRSVGTIPRSGRAGGLISSALMARVNETVSLIGFAVSVALGLYWLWKIVRTPGEL